MERLEDASLEYTLNPHGRRLREEELVGLLGDKDALIAGVEPITASVMDRAPRLRVISRVGVGLDSVDLLAARERGIAVGYTPDAPSEAVAELTLGLILNLLRGIGPATEAVRSGRWTPILGRSLGEVTLGVFGVNRIGKRVIRHLAGSVGKVLACDLFPDEAFGREVGLEWTDKGQILREADVITLHVPLAAETRGFIGEAELAWMKPDALLVNTARGGIIDEGALAKALRTGAIGGAALDVYEEEPYVGELAGLNNCLLTCHMAALTRSSRVRMEVEAVENILAFFAGGPLPSPVPESEYEARRSSPRPAT